MGFTEYIQIDLATQVDAVSSRKLNKQTKTDIKSILQGACF